MALFSSYFLLTLTNKLTNLGKTLFMYTDNESPVIEILIFFFILIEFYLFLISFLQVIRYVYILLFIVFFFDLHVLVRQMCH